jgi:predicted permease
MMLSRLRSLWRNLVRRDRMQRDLDDELRAVFELLVEERIARGMSAADARRAAAIDMGGSLEPIKDKVRDVKMGQLLETLFQDLKYAGRRIRRSPGFALAAILTLALGIGANAAVFTMLNAITLKRLPIPDADGLMAIAPVNSRGLPRTTPMSAVGELQDGPLDHLCAYLGTVVFPVLANNTPVQTSTTFITGQCFAALGISPIVGRGITDADSPINGPGAHIAVITHRLWTSVYNNDPSVIGKPLLVNNVPVTIVGVLPPGFVGLEIDTGIDIFTPFDAVLPAARGRRQLASYLLGRLRPGITREAAAAQIEARWPALLETVLPAGMAPTERTQLMDSKPQLLSMGTGASRLRDRYTRPLTLIFGLTGLLLVLACVNLGALLLSRANARSNELALRLALGGSRARLAQQIIVECVVLALCGAGLAIPMAYATAATLTSFLPPINIPYAISMAPDVRVFAATTMIAVAVGIAMSLLPVALTARRGSALNIRSERTVSGSPNLWGRALLVVQIALAAVMLIDATLLTRSLYLLQTRDLGIRTDNILTVKMWSLPNVPISRGASAAYYPTLLEQVRALPGVRAAAAALTSPRMATMNPGAPVAWRGDAYGDLATAMDLVSPGYFSTMGMQLIAGRDVSWQDTQTSEKVAVVSESLARSLSSNGMVLGRGIHLRTLPVDLEYVIVGVVSDATMGDPHEAHPRVVYRPLLQGPASGGSLNANLIIETTDTASAANGVRQILRDGGRDYALEIISLDDLLARAPATERMSATVAAAVGGIAVLLAVIGVHGVLAYSVARRTREIGVRIAVGAMPSAAAAAVLREALVICTLGLMIGIPLAAASARSLRSLMFGISEADPWTFAAAAAGFLVVGVLAAIVPARRAANVDPVIALRTD